MNSAFKLIRQFAFVVAVLAATTQIADAATAKVRTSDWKLQQSTIYGVVYWSDYNNVYGTNYYTITLGL